MDALLAEHQDWLQMASKFSKEPSFKDQPADSVIELVAARLVVFPTPDSIFVSGSCVRIAKNLYLTARHVVTDYLDRFGHQDHVIDSWEVWTIHVRPGPAYSIWQVDRLYLSIHSDLAVLHTTPYNDTAAHEDVGAVGLELSPPSVGERVTGFGYHSAGGNITFGADSTRHISVDGFGAACVGEVMEVHPVQRDAMRLNFPCYRVNCRFDGGMSGGPLFNDRGKLCGVISSNLPPDDETGQHVSYAASLWPLMAVLIDVDTKGETVDQPYPVLELAKAGIISTVDAARVIVSPIPGSPLLRQVSLRAA